MPTYHDFTITLHASPQGYELTAHGPGEIAIPPQPLPAEVAAQLHAAAAIQTSAALSGDEMKSAGAQFYRALFPPAVASAFAAAQQVVALTGSLRLRLAIYPPELNALPWELLYHPEQERFLAALLTQPVVRYIESATPAAPLRAEKPLRLLYVQSMPADLPSLDLEASERALRQALSGAAEITALRQPTPQALQDVLRQPFHALHYDGHAYFDETSSALLLTDENGNANPLRSADLAYALNGTTIRLVVLAACQSGMDARRARFSGLAHELMKASNLPAVVAMQDSISDAAALAFTGGFYRALADEYPLDAAVTEGRKAILSGAGGELATAEWATPVVFLRGDGQLFALPEDAPAPGVSPYKGLQYFDESDADLFFGRAQLSQTLAERLRAGRFLAVVGASGSGKSSLVRAGLLPQLRQAGGWAIVPPFTPAMGSEPLQALAAALIPLLEPGLGELDRLAEAKKLAARLKASEISLCEVAGRIAQKQGAARLAVVVDQFEELFTTFRDKAPLQAEFVEVLLAAAEGDSPLTVILTLRADFYASCAQFGGLRAALENHQAFIGPMTCDELRQAIEEPARRGGWLLEDGLVEMLLRDVGDEPGNLPLLSHALLETWQRRKGRTLTLQGYRQSGGVSGAIARTADSVFGGLSAEQQAVARRIFLGLTELGEGTQDTRRRAALEEIAPQAEGRPAVEAVLKLLADARLVTTSEQAVEVAHEALIREWPALRRWLDEDRASLRLHRELNEDARGWADLKRDAGALYRGARLAAAAEWAAAHAAELTPLEGEFLHASQQAVEQEEREREAQRQRELQQAQQLVFMQRQRATVLAISLVVALALTALAVGFMFNARENLGKANAAGTQAAENLQAAQQNAATATNALGLSEQRGTQAAEQAATAQAASTQAVAQQATAEAESQRANQQAHLAFSRQLAAQAVSHFDDNLALSLLLGVEAYRIENTFEARNSLLGGLQYNPQLIGFLYGEDSAVFSVAYSPDGTLLVAGHENGKIAFWDTKTHQLAGNPLLAHTRTVRCVAFSPDGKLLASGGDDKTVILWDVPSRQKYAELMQPTPIFDAKFSPDGRTLAIAGQYQIGLWDVETRQQRRQISSPAKALAYSLDGKTLASAGEDGIELWDAETLQIIGSMSRQDGPAWVDDIAFSPDGQLLASVNGSGDVLLWDVTSRSLLFEPQEKHQSYAYQVAFSPDGNTIASSSYDNTVILWDVVRHLEFVSLQPREQILRGHSSWVMGISFSPDGRTLASGSGDKSIALWSLEAEQPIISVLPDMGSDPVFSADSQKLAFTASDNTIVLWDMLTKQTLAEAPGKPQALCCAAFHPDGQMLAYASNEEIVLWNTVTRKIEQAIPVYTTPVTSLAFSPDGRILASMYAYNTVVFLDMETKTFVGLPWTVAENHILQMGFTASGNLLFADDSGEATMLNPHNGELADQFRLSEGRFTTFKFNAQGTQAATAETYDYSIHLWDVARRAVLGDLFVGVQGYAESFAFSPDGKLLAAGYRRTMSGLGNDSVILWDTVTRQPVGQPFVGVGQVSFWAFSPDGKTLASRNTNGNLFLWDIDPQSWLEKTCQITGRNLTQSEWALYFPGQPYHTTCHQWLEGK